MTSSEICEEYWACSEGVNYSICAPKISAENMNDYVMRVLIRSGHMRFFELKIAA